MKLAIWFPPSCAVLLLLSSCANNKSAGVDDPIGTGPFDSAGNYREDWADDPSKWRRPGTANTRTDDLPQIAKNEEPPPNANPLPVATTQNLNQNLTTTRKTSTSQPVSTKPKPVVAQVKPKAKPKPATVRYTVKKGDSLSAIAQRNNTSVAALRRANGISGTLIRPGQKLIIPRR